MENEHRRFENAFQSTLEAMSSKKLLKRPSRDQLVILHGWPFEAHCRCEISS